MAFFYEWILNYNTNRTFLIRTFNSHVPIVKDLHRFIRIQMEMRIQFELLSFSDFCVIMNFLILIDIEMEFAVHFASQRENDY
jgi:hypothetical protein